MALHFIKQLEKLIEKLLKSKRIILILISIVALFYKLTEIKPYLPKYDIIKIGNQNASAYITIVSIYFKFPSKHSMENYTIWSNTFLSSVSSPVILFTDQQSMFDLKKKAEKLKLNVTFYVTKNAMSLINHISVWRNKNYVASYLRKQNYLDPEYYIHSPNLYAVWNSKHFLMKLASELNPYNSEFFIYTDIGAWRSEVLENWPDVDFVKELAKILNGKALYSQINNIDTKNITSSVFEGIEGGIIAGSKNAINKIADAFYKIHDEWFDRGIFIGKDQVIMNELAYKQYPYLVKRLMSWRIQCNKTIDVWFFYQFFLAQNKYYYCKNEKLSLIT